MLVNCTFFRDHNSCCILWSCLVRPPTLVTEGINFIPNPYFNYISLFKNINDYAFFSLFHLYDDTCYGRYHSTTFTNEFVALQFTLSREFWVLIVYVQEFTSLFGLLQNKHTFFLSKTSTHFERTDWPTPFPWMSYGFIRVYLCQNHLNVLHSTVVHWTVCLHQLIRNRMVIW